MRHPPAGWLLLGLLSRLSPAADSPTTAYAFGLPLATPTVAAAYRFVVPPAVYEGTYRADLGDLRVFNADGEAVATFLQSASGSDTAPEAVDLPLFPLPAGARAVADDVHVTIRSQGSGVELRTRSGSDAAGVPQYIVDGRPLAAPLSGMRLIWPETELPFSGRLSIEASDDLGRWHLIVGDAPVANLRSNGQAIVQNQIALPLTTARFWRLSWIGGTPNFVLSAVAATPAKGAQAERSAVDLTPVRRDDRDFYFDLSGHPPVDRVGLVLSEENTVATVELFSRPRENQPWRRLTEGRFFRVLASDGQLDSPPVEIATDRDRYWLARVASTSGLSASPFLLRVQWVPEEVTFLARGHAPYLLAYGSAAAENVRRDAGPLPADIHAEPAQTGPPQILGGQSRLTASSPPVSRLRVTLWGVLLAAVAFLAWMAYGLSKQKKSEN